MKGYRFIAFLLTFVMLFSMISCDKNKKKDDENGDGNENNQQADNNGDTQQGAEGRVTFYYSVNSDVYHIEGCYHIHSIDEEFLKTSTNVAELSEKGKAPCKDCIISKAEPDEDEEDKITKEEATYVISGDNGKIHELDCHNVKKIQDKNLIYTDLTIEELLELDENAPCLDCLTDAANEYYERHPEKDPRNED